MTALMHYAWLKGTRDRSLLVFALIPPVQIACVLVAMAAFEGQLRYPLPILINWPGDDSRAFAVLLPASVATLSAFWTLRSEVATRAISSFVVASRPLTVVAALVTFAAGTAAAGLMAMFGVVVLLTGTVPPAVLEYIGDGLLAAVAGGSLGALYVTIWPQPAMLIWAFLVGLPAVPFLMDDASSRQVLTINAVLPIIAIAISTFLLRRRCAS